MQAVVRPSALPVLKTYQNGTLSSSDAASSPENDSAPSPIYDRQRRAGSTPTRSIPAPGFFRSSVARHAASTIHINSLNNNNNHPSKLKTQMSLTTIRSSKNAGTESPKEVLSRRHSARVSTVVPASVSSSNQNGRSRTSETNPSSLNPAKNSASVSSSNATTSTTNNQKSNLARCSITRAIVTKLQPNTTTKNKGIRNND